MRGGTVHPSGDDAEDTDGTGAERIAATKENRDATIRARYTTTEEAGHSRLSITSAYYGSTRVRKATPSN